MAINKQILISGVLTLAAAAGVLGYSWTQQRQSQTTFPESGYILTGDPEVENKQVMFSGGTAYRSGLDDTVSFDDIQGNKTEVSAKSFVHYDGSDLSALSDGVVVDLNDIGSARVTNHYAVSSRILFESDGRGYTPSNASSDLTMTDFLWKVSEDKYMLVSDNLSIMFGGEDIRDATNYLEVSYIDGGVIQLQTEENLWQTVSNVCYAQLDNGETVDLALRNVQDENGGVLLDFAKVVLDSEDNKEIIPLTEELRNVHETVIPHFDITAEPGADGEAGAAGAAGAAGNTGADGEEGQIGEDGDAGEAGFAGDPGDAGTSGQAGTNGSSGSAGSAGSNGGAGASGSDGAAGAPGEPGINGLDGGSAEVEGNVLQFPVFTLGVGNQTPADISAWTVYATSCSGNIMVSDPGNMLRQYAPGNVEAAVYLVDVSTGRRITNDENGPYNFYLLGAANTGYPFSFSNLEPDHSYRLVVEAPIQTSNDAGIYTRTFIDKTFWTDSTGFYMEAGNSSVSTVNAQVYKQSYASASSQAYIRFYTTYDAAAAARADDSSGAWTQVNADVGGSANVTYPSGGALGSNTTVYARLKVQNGTEQLMLPQIMPLTTLKETASLGAPSLGSNRDSWGFDLTPGTVYDKDKGISGYIYEFYAEGSVNSTTRTLIPGAQPVRTVAAATADGLVVPMDGSALIPGRNYYVRTVATFFDNEKSFEIVSPLSNLAAISGSQRPAVYYTNAASSDPGNNPTGTSANYDVIYGTVHVDPGTTGSRLLLDSTHTATLTIRASGYYFVKYQVVNAADPPTSYDTTNALQATVRSGGYVDIPLSMRELTNAGLLDKGDAAGLRPNTSYSLIVSGHLTQDGTNSTGYDQTVGTVIVKTQDTVALTASWGTLPGNASGDPLKGVTFTLQSALGSAATATETHVLAQQYQTMSRMVLTLYSGSLTTVNPTQLGQIILTSDRTDTAAYQKLKDLRVDGDTGGETLGEIAQRGIQLELEDFNLKSTDVSSLSAVHLAITDVYDYTYFAANRTHQTDYVFSTPDDDTDPETMNGYVYVTEFTVNTNQFEIELMGQPDPVPARQEGFDTSYRHTVTGDPAVSAYYLHPNYPNGAKLATSIDYYVFDAPDFYHDYSSDGNWVLDTDRFPSTASNVSDKGLKTPVTVKKSDGTHPWLGHITIPLSTTSSTIPTVDFIAKTQANAELGYKDSSGNFSRNGEGNYGKSGSGNRYYMFFDEGSEEKTNGHQYVFAWTLTYRMEDDQETKLYYPFDYAYLGMNGYQNQFSIPHSRTFDRPLSLPKIYALPWSMQAGNTGNTGTTQNAEWYIYVYDSEGAVVQDDTDEGTANLWRKFTGTTGAILGINNTQIPVKIHANDLSAETADALIAEGNRVVIPYEASWTDNNYNVPVALRLQRYSDKYVVSTSTKYQANAFPADTDSPVYTVGQKSLYTGSSGSYTDYT